MGRRRSIVVSAGASAVLLVSACGGGSEDRPPTVAEVHAQMQAASPHLWLMRSDHMALFMHLQRSLKDLSTHGTTLDPVRFTQLCGELKAAATAAQTVDEPPPAFIAPEWREAVRLSLKIARDGQAAAEVIEIRGIGLGSLRLTRDLPAEERRAWKDLDVVGLFIKS